MHPARDNEFAPVLTNTNRHPTKAILTAWLAAGSFDILAAFITTISHGGTALGVLKAVASGLIGSRAIGGGWGITLLGLLLHYAIMLGIVLVYYLASRRMPLLIARPFIAGPLYGALVYAAMNLLVLPMSAIIFKPSYTVTALCVDIPVHMLCVGLPIAWVFHRFAHQTKT